MTAHDRFTSDPLEDLECLWLEAVYHEHNGNLRQSWLTCRRAISAGQLLGFPGQGRTHMPQMRSILQEDRDALDLQQLWLRLVHKELALCPALGMQPSAFCPNDTFLSVANSATPEDDARHTSKLERRSERDPGFEDLHAALQINTELEDAAAAMPSAWWIMPSLADTDKLSSFSSGL